MAWFRTKWGLAWLLVLAAIPARADLSENFDASTAVPAGWTNNGTVNWNNAAHYKSPPNCRALATGQSLQTPGVDYPTNLSFNVDSSTAGNNKTGTVSYSTDGGANWTLLGNFIVITAGANRSFSLNSSPDLSAFPGVFFRFNSTFTTWYLDDVVVNTGPVPGTNMAPTLSLSPAETNPVVLVGTPVTCTVTAMEPDGDEITLRGLNLPTGATFDPNPKAGTSSVANAFAWTPTNAGVTSFSFSAEDKDGTNQIDLSISAYAADPTLLLVEDFDDSSALPSGWEHSGTENHTDALHYSSSPNCRALGAGDTLATPAVDYPTNLSFYVDASNGGNGQMAAVSYRIGSSDWVLLDTFAALTVGTTETFSLQADPDLSTNTGVQFQFSSSFSTWYLDDVVIRGGQLTDVPPVLAPIGPQMVALSNTLSLAIRATDIDQDDIVLSASNLPPGATFDTVTNAGNITNYLVYAPEDDEAGLVYTSTVYATDTNGTDEETFTISVYDRLVTFTAAETSAWESDDTLRFGVALSRPGAATVEVSASGTAVAGPEGDYVLSTTNLEFTADGSPTQWVEVVLADDAEPEEAETLVLALTNAAGAGIGPTVRHTVTIRDNDAAFYEPFDRNPGWSTQGQWAFGQPTGGGYWDPSSSYTGTNVYGYNLAGNYANNMSAPLYLTTPAIDCTRFRNVHLRFARWLNVEGYYYDYASIQISRDRQNWADVWVTSNAFVGDWNGWTVLTYDISAVADGAPAVFIRWGMGPTDSAGVYGGWNIDDVTLTGAYTTNAIFRLAAAGYSARETTNEVRVSVARLGLTNIVSEIVFVTSNQTATAGEDYEAVEETLVFAPGETNKIVGISLQDDGDAEGIETLGLYLRPTATGDTADPAVATLVLQDDEIPGAAIPFFDGFEAGVFADCWTPASTGNGRIQVSGEEVSPFEGFGQAQLDATNYTYGLNELILTADLTGQTNVILDFQENNFDYYRETMPARFVGSTNADGVAVSADGVNWHRLLDATNQSGYVHQAVSLSAFAVSHGLALGPNFEIKFQQYDRYWLPIYGRCFDNVQLYDPTQVADVRLAVQESEDPVAPGSNLVYRLLVTNAGPRAAADVVISNRLPAGVGFVSAESSQGTCSQETEVVTCWLGGLASGGTATVSIVVVPAAPGVLTNRCGLTNSTFDPVRTNNWVFTTTVVDEPGGTLQLATAVEEIEETSGSVRLLVTRTNHTYGVMTVHYAAVEGTALAGADYTATAGTLTLTNGQTNVYITIPVLDDSLDEPTEAFTCLLDTPGGGADLGACTSAVISIFDDDGRAPFPFAETFENGGLSNYWRIYSSSGGEVVVTTNFAPHGGDYHVALDAAEYSGANALNELVLTVDLAGQQGVTLAFWHRQFSDDTHTMGAAFTNHQYADGVAMSMNGTNWVKVRGLTAAEGSSNAYGYFEVALDPIAAANGLTYNSTFKIKFQQCDNYPISTDGFVFDDISLFARHGDLRFSQAACDAAETGGVAVITVERVNGSYGAVSVPYVTADGTAEAGRDYAAASGTLVFADGVTTGSFAVTLFDDAEDEPAETLQLLLGAPTGGAALAVPSNAVLNLSDNDGGGEFAFSADLYAAVESNGTATVTVWRRNGAEGEVTVDYTMADSSATDGEDYAAAAGTLSFAAGVTQQQFTVTILDDAVREDTETVLLALENPSAGTALDIPNTATLRIVDDEDPNFDYYAPAYGKTGAELREALHNIIRGHTPFSYDTLWTILKEVDECPTNSAQVQLVYMQTGRDENNNGGGSGQWNREHVWPQSHGFPDALSTTVPPSVDAHHLKPSDVDVNSLRGEKDFDDGGTHVAGTPASCLTTASTFAPPDSSKGDVARMMFYMDVRYSGDVDGEPDLQLVEAVDTGGTQLGRLSTLIRWHFLDPPDDFERRRNDLIYANWQGNRNPFIDHPEWVLRIWEYNVTIATVAGAHGDISPANPQVPYHSDQAFEIQPAAYYHIADIRTNGASLGAAYGTSAYTFVWSQVVTNGTLEADFAEDLAVHDTPHWWLAAHDFTNDFDAAALDDPDVDGMPTWQEYQANTRPDDPLSLLQFEAIQPVVDGDLAVLTWQSASNRVYSIWRSTNLTDGFGLRIATNLPATPTQNSYTDTVNGAEGLFYRIELGP